jgi:two-component system OmpR family sensor kinase
VLVVAEATEPGTVTVKVADDGEGMPPELVGAPAGEARLPDARRHGSRESGAGLGLSIATGIVAAHGGRMELEQAPRGTCFVITLPVEDQQSRGKGPDTID